MIPITQPPCSGEVHNYQFSNRLCSDYTLRQFNALFFGSKRRYKAKLLHHHLKNQIKCVPCIKLRRRSADLCLWMLMKFPAGLPIIQSVQDDKFMLVRAPAHAHFYTSLMRLNSPEEKTDFNHIHTPPSGPLGNRVTKVFIHTFVTYLNRSAGDLNRMSNPRKASVEATYMHVPIKTIPRRLYPPGKEMKFNRMNGSPGDPPGNRMHQFKPKNRPFHSPSRGRSIQQGGWLGDKHRRYQTCQ